jgi:hypothetical protein
MQPALVAFGYAPQPPPWHDPPRWIAGRGFAPFLAWFYGSVIFTLSFDDQVGFYAIACVKVWAHMFFYGKTMRDVVVAVAACALALATLASAGNAFGSLAVSCLLALTVFAVNVDGCTPDRASRIVAAGCHNKRKLG